jgi:cytochrome c biogenesis protein ResB
MKQSDDIAGRPAVEIEIEANGEKTEHLIWADTPLDVPGYRLFYAQEERVRDFYSVLEVVDDGKVVLEKKIEVNDPLRYGGYTFYQSSYDSKGLSWSGLQVRNDPGVPLVYAGFAVQLLGMIVIFYINPLIRKAKKDRA